MIGDEKSVMGRSGDVKGMMGRSGDDKGVMWRSAIGGYKGDDVAK